MLAILPASAPAQTKLAVDYRVSLLGLTVGRGSWGIEINGDQYAYQVATIVTPLYPLLRMSLGLHPTFLLPYVDDEVIFHKAVASQMELALEALQCPFSTLPVGTADQVEYILEAISDTHAEDQE